MTEKPIQEEEIDMTIAFDEETPVKLNDRIVIGVSRETKIDRSKEVSEYTGSVHMVPDNSPLEPDVSHAEVTTIMRALLGVEDDVFLITTVTRIDDALGVFLAESDTDAGKFKVAFVRQKVVEQRVSPFTRMN